ncbi:dephospho-CoA kinase [Reinekea sp. G2M2-21]|uniref:dephospho-CoA kinase n=1 Tax=Reinekea sp. G2M2-21 TaxID=2788942 RepID=UPI0018AB6E3B
MIVGLTGGIGCGKSTVARFFAELGITVVDADQVARDVVSPGTDALKSIKQHFGSQVIKEDQSLNRPQLRQLIFDNHDDKTWLENLLHPIIRKQMLTELDESKSIYSILEAPLLFENHLEAYCAKTVLVDVPVDLQIQRATQRDNADASTIQTIVDAQLPRSAKLEKADYVIDNSGDYNNAKMQVMRLDQILRLLAATEDFT